MLFIRIYHADKIEAKCPFHKDKIAQAIPKSIAIKHDALFDKTLRLGLKSTKYYVWVTGGRTVASTN